MRKQGSCVEKETMQGTMSDACRRGRPRTAWMDNINTWTGLPVEESMRMTENTDKWRKYVKVWPALGLRTTKNRREHCVLKDGAGSPLNRLNLHLTCVDSLDARVISRLPLSPSSAGTRMKISETSTNAGQCCKHTQGKDDGL